MPLGVTYYGKGTKGLFTKPGELEPGGGYPGAVAPTVPEQRPYSFGDDPILPTTGAGSSVFYTPPSSYASGINFTMPKITVPNAGGASASLAGTPATSYMDPGAQAAAEVEEFVIEKPRFGNMGGGTGTGLTAQQRIENALKDTALRTSQFGTQQAAQDILTRLQTAGQIPTSISDIIKNATGGQTKYVNDQFTNLMDLLTKQYGVAQDATTLGYDALRNYLGQNAPTAFANALQAAQAAPTAPVVNDIAQYMTNQGVNAAGAQPGLLAAQAAAQGGAANYQGLLNILAGQEKAGQASRLAEEQMGRTLAGSNLSALLNQQQGTLTASQLQALAQVQAQDAAARLAAQQQATAREQALQDAFNALLGTGYTTPTGTTPTIPTAPVVTSPIQKLAALPITNNPTLKKDVAKFVAANPNASIAKIEKKFPRLAANIK
jgi:hypothetical protein